MVFFGPMFWPWQGWADLLLCGLGLHDGVGRAQSGECSAGTWSVSIVGGASNKSQPPQNLRRGADLRSIGGCPAFEEFEDRRSSLVLSHAVASIIIPIIPFPPRSSQAVSEYFECITLQHTIV